jgi:hypothetical protein
MNYQIKRAAGHVEVLNENGEFLFSADNEHEAREELRSYEAA